MKWSDLYHNSYDEIQKNMKKIDGVTVGFNTNIDIVFDFRSSQILELLDKQNVDRVSLLSNILEWKGVIETPEDFVTGLCGCFEKGKASEWIIQNEETYQFLINNLPPPKSIQMGGQAGIITNVLSELGLNRVIVHSVTMPKALRKLFLRNKNIKFPIYNRRKKLKFIHPKRVRNFDNRLYFHLISEVQKGDTIKVSDRITWKCPRNNRFIATYDPPNAKLDILESFQKDIETIADLSDIFILSGFHMLNLEELGQDGLDEKILTILNLIERAKSHNQDLFVHLEQSSTKNDLILDRLFYHSRKKEYWDSIGCNERELVEILESIAEKRLAKKLRKRQTPSLLISACLRVCEKLQLQRLHLHQYGFYLLAIKKDYPLTKELLLKSLCFTSLVTAHKAITGKISGIFDYEEIIDTAEIDSRLNNEFVKILSYLSGKRNKELESSEYEILIIPSIIVEDPLYTVGLGDTISSTALVAETILKKLF